MNTPPDTPENEACATDVAITADPGIELQQSSDSNQANGDAASTPGNESDQEATAGRRKGKIARLPKDLRDQVNNGLLNGERYEDIITALGDSGKGITKVNLHNWSTGGYQDWLKEQRLLDECRMRHELTLDFARENHGTDGIQAAHNITIELICRAVAEFGPDTLKDAFQKNPLNLLRAIMALSRLTSGSLKFHKHQTEEAERKVRLEQKQGDGKKGISPEVLKQMIDQLNLM